MSYVDRLAREIQQELPRDLLPAGETDELFRLYALLALLKGTEVSTQDVHDAWSTWMSARDPNHRSLRPFGELDPETQRADEPFLAAIKTVVASRSRTAATS